MLFNIYLITTCFSYLVFISFVKTVIEREKKEGYSFRQSKKKRSILSKVRSIIKIMFVFSIPGYNFLSALGVLANSEEIYQKLKKMSIDEGSIYKIDYNNNQPIIDIVIEDGKTESGDVLLKKDYKNQDLYEDIVDLPSYEQGPRLIKQNNMNKYDK